MASVDAAAAALASQEYALGGIVNVGMLKNGHILKLASEKHGSNTAKNKHVVEKLRMQGMVVEKCDVSKVLTKNSSLVKSRGQVNGNKKLVAFYAQRFDIAVPVHCPQKHSSSTNTQPPDDRMRRLELRMEAQGQLKDKKINDLEQEVASLNEKLKVMATAMERYKKRAQRELKTSNQLRCQVDFKNRELLSLQRKFETLESRLAAEHS